LHAAIIGKPNPECNCDNIYYIELNSKEYLFRIRIGSFEVRLLMDAIFFIKVCEMRP